MDINRFFFEREEFMKKNKKIPKSYAQHQIDVQTINEIIIAILLIFVVLGVVFWIAKS